MHLYCGVTGAGCQRSWVTCWGGRLARPSLRRAGVGAPTNATELAEAMYGPAAADNLAAAAAVPADIPAVPIGSASAASIISTEAGVAPPATEPVAAGVVDGSAANVAAAAVAPAEAVASGSAGN